MDSREINFLYPTPFLRRSLKLIKFFAILFHFSSFQFKLVSAFSNILFDFYFHFPSFCLPLLCVYSFFILFFSWFHFLFSSSFLYHFFYSSLSSFLYYSTFCLFQIHFNFPSLYFLLGFHVFSFTFHIIILFPSNLLFFYSCLFRSSVDKYSVRPDHQNQDFNK